MLGVVADLISSVTTILLPVYASYKALRTSDPAQLTPWLLYWVVLSLLLLVESWTVFIIGWLPFYAWIRLIFLSYLVLPQTQGAKLLYYTYIEHFIVQHEHDIDLFIGQAHERLSEAGLGYLNQLIDVLCERVLGRAPASSSSHPAPSNQTPSSYAQSLFSRFAIPSARDTIAAPASDFYGMLSGAVAAVSAASSAMPRTRDVQADSLYASGSLYPKAMNQASTAEKLEFITAQREKLAVFMKALDREQQNLDLAYGDTSEGFGQKKNKSTHSFETVEHADAENDSGVSHVHHTNRAQGGSRTASGSWIPSGWWPSGGNTGDKSDPAGSSGWNAAREITEAVQGTSSSIDTSR